MNKTKCEYGRGTVAKRLLYHRRILILREREMKKTDT